MAGSRERSVSSFSTQEPLLAGGVTSPLPPGRQVVRGQGGCIWDDRGNAYTDLIMGYGAISIGHGELEVVKAVTAQAMQGTLLPGRTRGEDKARESLHALFPHTAAASLHKTGSEAVAAAIRIARTATGRMSVVRCGFHGWHDEMIQSNRRWHNSQGPESIMPSVVPGVRDGLAPL